MDRTLALLQNADPADPAPDSAELNQLEGKNLNTGVNLVSLPVTAAVGPNHVLFCLPPSLFNTEQGPVSR